METKVPTKVVNQIQESNLVNHGKKKLIEAVDRLATNSNAEQVADTFANLLYYTSNPDRAKELEKDDIAQLTTDVMNLLSNLLKVYGRYDDLEYHEHYDQPTQKEAA